MKSYFLFLGLFLFCSIGYSQKSIKINGITYHQKKQKVFLKDERIFTEYVVYKKIKSKAQFTYEYLRKRNDSIFVKGNFRVKKNMIITVENYYFSDKTDSIVRTAKQLKNGSIQFVDMSRYKNGKSVYYFKNP
ncbi:MAG: hypothetical protein CFE24_06885 [Flavobacterium sp. BFFFF2]|nr:MAG: hypothetical protein CFE24_06885 [Flavobacterium sp. BFFFF2]